MPFKSNYPWLKPAQEKEKVDRMNDIETTRESLWQMAGFQMSGSPLGVRLGFNKDNNVGSSNMTSQFTGYGEDGVLQPDKPTNLLNTNRGPVVTHEGEMIQRNGNGTTDVVPANMVPQNSQFSQDQLSNIEKRPGVIRAQRGISGVIEEHERPFVGVDEPHERPEPKIVPPPSPIQRPDVTDTTRLRVPIDKPAPAEAVPTEPEVSSLTLPTSTQIGAPATDTAKIQPIQQPVAQPIASPPQVAQPATQPVRATGDRQFQEDPYTQFLRNQTRSRLAGESVAEQLRMQQELGQFGITGSEAIAEMARQRRFQEDRQTEAQAAITEQEMQQASERRKFEMEQMLNAGDYEGYANAFRDYTGLDIDVSTQQDQALVNAHKAADDDARTYVINNPDAVSTDPLVVRGAQSEWAMTEDGKAGKQMTDGFRDKYFARQQMARYLTNPINQAIFNLEGADFFGDLTPEMQEVFKAMVIAPYTGGVLPDGTVIDFTSPTGFTDAIDTYVSNKIGAENTLTAEEQANLTPEDSEARYQAFKATVPEGDLGTFGTDNELRAYWRNNNMPAQYGVGTGTTTQVSPIQTPVDAPQTSKEFSDAEDVFQNWFAEVPQDIYDRFGGTDSDIRDLHKALGEPETYADVGRLIGTDNIKGIILESGGTLHPNLMNPDFNLTEDKKQSIIDEITNETDASKVFTVPVTHNKKFNELPSNVLLSLSKPTGIPFVFPAKTIKSKDPVARDYFADPKNLGKVFVYDRGGDKGESISGNDKDLFMIVSFESTGRKVSSLLPKETTHIVVLRELSTGEERRIEFSVN